MHKQFKQKVYDYCNQHEEISKQIENQSDEFKIQLLEFQMEMFELEQKLNELYIWPFNLSLNLVSKSLHILTNKDAIKLVYGEEARDRDSNCDLNYDETVR
jgi:hypothetical protein